jgi:uncharacterized protein YlzI (FlbEa/FlbD family)
MIVVIVNGSSRLIFLDSIKDVFVCKGNTIIRFRDGERLAIQESVEEIRRKCLKFYS